MEIRTDLALEAREMIDEKRSGSMKRNHALPEGMQVNSRETEYMTITKLTSQAKPQKKRLERSAGNI